MAGSPAKLALQGGKPSGWRPNNERNVRGTVVLPRVKYVRPDDGPTGEAVFDGNMPGVIVYLKVGSGKLIKDWNFIVNKTSVEATPLGDNAGDAFQLVGSITDLERLVVHPAVARYHVVIGVRVPIGAAGAGEEPFRPSGKSMFAHKATAPSVRAVLDGERNRRAMEESRAEADARLAFLMDRKRAGILTDAERAELDEIRADRTGR